MIEQKIHELETLIFNNLNEFFPDLYFTRHGEKWESPFHFRTKELSKSSSRDQSFIFSKCPFMIYDQNGDKENIFVYSGSGNYIDGIKNACQFLGLNFDEFAGTPEQAEKYSKIEKLRFEILQESKNALKNSPVYEYLTQTRHLTEQFIEFANFGFLSEKVKELFVELKKIDGNFFHYGENYPLIIPNFSAGQIYGFTFRTISNDIQPKYKNERGQKNGIFGLELSAIYKDNISVACEGQIDCLRAKFAGIENCIATQGQTFSDKQIEILKKRQIKHLVFIPDFDFDTEQNIAKESKNLIPFCDKLESNGIFAYIAKFPDDNKKIDIDSFLMEHEPDELKSIIGNAVSIAKFRAGKIAKKYENQSLTDIQINNLIDDFSQLLTKYLTRKNDILSVWNEHKFEQYCSINEIFSNIEKRENERKNKLKIERYIKDIEQYSNDNQFEKAKETIKKIESLFNKKIDISTIFHDSQFYKNLLKIVPDGIGTNIFFKLLPDEDKNEIKLNAGTITTIGAKTGHGKSTFLRNMVVNILQKSKSDFKPILYFSFEEPKQNVYYRLNKISDIDSYFDNKKILIIDDIFDISDIMETIKQIHEQTGISVVFFDYIQMITDTKSKENRTYLIDTIMNQINSFAIQTNVPFVIASQLSRQVQNADKLENSVLSDSKSIEHRSSEIFMLWNWETEKFDIGLCENGRYNYQNEFSSGRNLFIKNTKSRSHSVGGYDTLIFDGKTGTIKNFVSGTPSEPDRNKRPVPKHFTFDNNEQENLPF